MEEYCCYSCLKTRALVCGYWILLAPDRVWWLVCVKAVMTLRDPESWDISGKGERLSASKQGLGSLELVRLKISLILLVVAVTNDVLCHHTV